VRTRRRVSTPSRLRAPSTTLILFQCPWLRHRSTDGTWSSGWAWELGAGRTKQRSSCPGARQARREGGTSKTPDKTASTLVPHYSGGMPASAYSPGLCKQDGLYAHEGIRSPEIYTVVSRHMGGGAPCQTHGQADHDIIVCIRPTMLSLSHVRCVSTAIRSRNP